MMQPDEQQPEGAAMERDQLIEALSKEGYDRSVLEGMDDEQLGECARVMSGTKTEQAAEDNSVSVMTPGMKQPPEKPMQKPAAVESEGTLGGTDNDQTGENEARVDAYKTDDMADDPNIPGDDPESGGNEGDEASMMAEHCNMMADHFKKMGDMYSGKAAKMSGRKMAEGDTPALHPVNSAPPYAGSGAKAAPPAAKMSELEGRQKRIELAISKRERELKRDTIHAFCERMVRAGKMLPAEVAGFKRSALMADDVKVYKFSETDKGTALDNLKKMVEARPNLVQFGERADVRGGKAPPPIDNEIAKVGQYFEKFSEDFRKTKQTKEKLVEGFKAMRSMSRATKP